MPIHTMRNRAGAWMIVLLPKCGTPAHIFYLFILKVLIIYEKSVAFNYIRVIFLVLFVCFPVFFIFIINNGQCAA